MRTDILPGFLKDEYGLLDIEVHESCVSPACRLFKCLVNYLRHLPTRQLQMTPAVRPRGQDIDLFPCTDSLDRQKHQWFFFVFTILPQEHQFIGVSAILEMNRESHFVLLRIIMDYSYRKYGPHLYGSILMNICQGGKN